MRYLTPYIRSDLKKKMVFLGGPRQVGKTTLAKHLLKQERGLYLNWDRISEREKILKEQWTNEDQLLVFDEIHKFFKWKNLIKGFYDSLNETHCFLITGSARLDLYKKGGDSLMGRYHYWRLHPFTLDEFPDHKMSHAEAFQRLMQVGGFPEPFLDNHPREARRWREERYEKVIRNDIRDLSSVRNIQLMEVLFELLRKRVGGEVVISHLASDLQISPLTVAQWIEIFEKMYLIFKIKPYTKHLARSIQKPFKIYFFDNADVIGDVGATFENLVATHLLKRCHFYKDYTGENWELGFLRDKEHHEVDFILLKDQVIQEIIEVKWSDQNISKSLMYFAEKLKVPKATQLMGQMAEGYSKKNLFVTPVLSYFMKKPTDHWLK